MAIKWYTDAFFSSVEGKNSSSRPNKPKTGDYIVCFLSWYTVFCQTVQDSKLPTDRLIFLERGSAPERVFTRPPPQKKASACWITETYAFPASNFPWPLSSYCDAPVCMSAAHTHPSSPLQFRSSQAPCTRWATWPARTHHLLLWWYRTCPLSGKRKDRYGTRRSNQTVLTFLDRGARKLISKTESVLLIWRAYRPVPFVVAVREVPSSSNPDGEMVTAQLSCCSSTQQQ